MKKPVILLLIVMLMSGMIPATSAYSQENITFRVRVAYTGLQDKWIKKGKSYSDEMTLTLPGELYDPPLAVLPVSKDKVSLSTPVDAMASDLSAFKMDDKEWVMDNFVPEERGMVEDYFKNTKLREKYKIIMQGRTRVLIYGYCYYKDYAFVFYRYNDEKSVAFTNVLKKTDGGWKRTYALAGDETFDIAKSAFRLGQMSIAGK